MQHHSLFGRLLVSTQGAGEFSLIFTPLFAGSALPTLVCMGDSPDFGGPGSRPDSLALLTLVSVACRCTGALCNCDQILLNKLVSSPLLLQLLLSHRW